MAFKEVRLDPHYTYGSEIGPTYKTTVLQLASNDEQRIGHWQNGRLKMVISKDNLTPDEAEELAVFFRTMKGKLHGFRARNWQDWNRDTDQPMQVIDGTHGQMIIEYTEPVTGDIETQKITKPVLAADVESDPAEFLYAPDITLKRNAVAWPSSGNWTLDRTTGIITYNADQTGQTIEWQGSFDWPVRFDTDEALIGRESSQIFQWNRIPLVELKQ